MGHIQILFSSLLCLEHPSWGAQNSHDLQICMEPDATTGNNFGVRLSFWKKIQSQFFELLLKGQLPPLFMFDY